MCMYLQDAIEAKREQFTQNNETIDENNMFLDVVGGQQKGRVYGIGSLIRATVGSAKINNIYIPKLLQLP